VYGSRGVVSDKRGGGIASERREGGRKGRRESFATAGEGKRSDATTVKVSTYGKRRR